MNLELDGRWIKEMDTMDTIKKLLKWTLVSVSVLSALLSLGTVLGTKKVVEKAKDKD